jgi:hypothetical protein
MRAIFYMKLSYFRMSYTLQLLNQLEDMALLLRYPRLLTLSPISSTSHTNAQRPDQTYLRNLTNPHSTPH